MLVIVILAGMASPAHALFCIQAHSFDKAAATAPRFSGERLAQKQFHTSQFREIPDTVFRNLRFFPSREDMFRAELQGHAVIGKRAPEGNLKEGAWLQELNNLGLGAKLHGITRIADQIYIVMADVGGVNTQLPMMAPAGFSINIRVINEMRRQAQLLIDQGVYPLDLQFQISRDLKQVVLIDPQYFEMREPSAELQRLGQMALQGIIMNWHMDGRVDH